MTLLAPRAAGGVLVGAGPGEVSSAWDWESPDVASLWGAAVGVPESFVRRLRRFDLALAYTRSAELAGGLRAHIERVVARDPDPPPGAHASVWLAESVETLVPGLLPEPPILTPTLEEREAAAELAAPLPEGFLAIHPGSGSTSKNWPPERFAALVRALAAGNPWLLVEGPADGDAAARLRAATRGAIRARDLPVRRLGALLSRAGLFAGNDSGVSHLAAAFGAPTLALFGPTDPAVWAPVGPRGRTLRASENRMDALSVESVVDAARALLASGEGFRSSAAARPSG